MIAFLPETKRFDFAENHGDGHYRNHQRHLRVVKHHLSKKSPSNALTIATMLENIRQHLLERFHQQHNRLGCFQEYLTAAPRLTKRAEQLLEEQTLLMGEICYIADEALSLLSADGIDRRILLSLRAHFSRFLTLWQEYESHETEMMLDALYEDIGVGD